MRVQRKNVHPICKLGSMPTVGVTVAFTYVPKSSVEVYSLILQDIYGPRFRCRTCYDFDFCFMCKLTSEKTHAEHAWDVSDA